MKKIRHYLIGLVALMFLPSIYLGWNLSELLSDRNFISLKVLMGEWWIQMISDESWGVFD